MLILYDGDCALCNRAVRFLMERDKEGKFTYEPNGDPNIDTLVLVEEGQSLYYGKAVLRICWHLGGWWRLLGVLSFLPTGLADAIYRLIARNRHLF
ncbi:MAG: thiol-disulfide oxidoreductase DCC family protein [Parachlamydiales bacterium]